MRMAISDRQTETHDLIIIGPSLSHSASIYLPLSLSQPLYSSYILHKQHFTHVYHIATFKNFSTGISTLINRNTNPVKFLII